MSDAVLLDTHALVWLIEGVGSLGRTARQITSAAARRDALLVSAIAFWEMALLTRRNRLALSEPVASWRRRVLELGIIEVPVSGDIGILAVELTGFHPDPADRIITASAVLRDATLVTADETILAWNGNLHRHDARS